MKVTVQIISNFINHVLGGSTDILQMEFDGCTAPPCDVYHGTTATGRITLKANSATNTLTCKVMTCLNN